MGRMNKTKSRFNMDASSTGVLFLCALVTLLIHLYQRARVSRAKLPPGPNGLPIIGNIHQFSALKAYPQVCRPKPPITPRSH